MKSLTEGQKLFLADLDFTEEEVAAIANSSKAVDVKEKEGTDAVEPKVEAKAEPEVQADVAKKESEDLRNEVAEALKSLAVSVQALTEGFTAIQADVKALKATDEQKIAEKAQDTPPLSLAELVKMTVIGDDSARIDGRKSLAQDGPKEAAPISTARFQVPFINEMVQNGKSLEEALGGSNG